MASELASLGGGTMGTTWRVHMAVSPRADLRACHRRIEAELEAVVQAMSTWLPDSDISRFNRSEAGSEHCLPANFAHVLRCALEVAHLSGGAFDPTVGPLVGLWGFGAHARRPQEIGQPEAVRTAHARVDWTQLTLDRERLRQPGGVQLDLSAIAKGYAADAVSAALAAQGIANSLVEVGGELRAAGRKPDGSAWRIAVEDAIEDINAPPCVIALDAQGVATSGDRWHSLDVGAHRVAHTLDPRRGVPVASQPITVTVIAEDAMHADAWATALRVLGPTAGLALAEQQALAARFHWQDNGRTQAAKTTAFEAYCVA